MSPVVEFFSALLTHHKRVEDSRTAAIWKKAAEFVLDDIQAQLAQPADDRGRVVRRLGRGRLLKQREKILGDFVSGTTVSPPQLYSKDDYLASIVKDHCPQAKIDLVDEEIDSLPFLSETPWQYVVKLLQNYDSRLTRQAIEHYLVTSRTALEDPEDDDIGETLHNLHHRGLIGEVLDDLRHEYPGLRDSLWEAWQHIGSTLQLAEPVVPADSLTDGAGNNLSEGSTDTAPEADWQLAKAKLAAEAESGRTAEPTSDLPAPKKPKRSTERGEARTKLIAALTRHHKYADDSCLELEPIGNNELARQADVDQSTASAFFKRYFKGHGKYKANCANVGWLATALKLLNNEFAPHLLYGAKPPDEHERDEE